MDTSIHIRKITYTSVYTERCLQNLFVLNVLVYAVHVLHRWNTLFGNKQLIIN